MPSNPDTLTYYKLSIRYGRATFCAGFIAALIAVGLVCFAVLACGQSAPTVTTPLGKLNLTMGKS